ncbi:MAG: heme oxygenase (biliverdin-producing) [Cyanobacteria bacterium REEB459]|nr:heme oxygenase (biliverdin-producing) [Cyanobacteria bacterium REEB459]
MTNLSAELREGTKKAHTMAENMGFVRCFLRGVVEKQSYRKLVANFYFIYGAMEEELDRYKDHPVVSTVYFPELYRRASLETDLAYYYGPTWRDQISLTEGGQTYVDRVRQVAHTQPELLVSHSYTRYIGDLSGGQILKGIAQRAMNLNDGQGTAFYEFPEIPDEKGFKARYRQSVDQAPLEDAMIARIVQEANDAFGLNMVMFKELEGNLIKAIGQMLFNSLTTRTRRGSTELATAE